MAGPRTNVNHHLARVADGSSSTSRSLNLSSTLVQSHGPGSQTLSRQPQASGSFTQKTKSNGFQFKDDTQIVKAYTHPSKPNPPSRPMPMPKLAHPVPEPLKLNPLQESVASMKLKRSTQFSPATSPGIAPKKSRTVHKPAAVSIMEDIPSDFFGPDDDEEAYMDELHPPPIPPAVSTIRPLQPTAQSQARVVNAGSGPSSGVASHPAPRPNLQHFRSSDPPPPTYGQVPTSLARQASPRRNFTPLVPGPIRAFTEPTLQEMDLETLYLKRHACITRINLLLQRMVTFLRTGSCETGEDFGCLEHTRSYLDARLNEFNAEVEHRRSRGDLIMAATPVVSHIAMTTPQNMGTIANKGYTSPSTTSRVSSEAGPVDPPPFAPELQDLEYEQEAYPPPQSSAADNYNMTKSRTSTDLHHTQQFANRPAVSPACDLNPRAAPPVSSKPPAQAFQNRPSSSSGADDLDMTIGLLDGIFSDPPHDTVRDVTIRQSAPPLPQQSHAPSVASKTTLPQQNHDSPSTSVTPDALAVPTEDYTKKMVHPWSRDVAKALKTIFKLQGWRRNQLDAINATLSGKNCFVLMPTGGGKSLCYQLPAVITSGATRGVTIVLSPLLSLITDQVQALCEKEIGAAAWTGAMTDKEKEHVHNDLRSDHPSLCLVYVTPELIMQSPAFMRILENLARKKLLARFVFDEAHCVSQWGHDFRPDYKNVGPKLAQSFKGIPILALTATANTRVRRDVIHNLSMQNCVTLTQSFNRPNLRYEVRPKTKQTMEDMIRIINVDHRAECGIVYCLSKKHCETVSEALIKAGVRSHHYHAGMSKNDRQRIQHHWQKGVLQLICATIAFGMGIDKPDVRFVIHYSMPSSLEGYYQETGRAGRDGRVSECILFYAYKDYQTFQKMIEQGDGSREQIERQLANARQVVGFCLNKLDCRRKLLLSYFSEEFAPDQCKKTCDTCKKSDPSIIRDVTGYVHSAITLIAKLTSTSRTVTMVHCMDVFKGSKNKKIIDLGDHLLDGAGAGSGLDRTDIERLFQLMVASDIVSEHLETNLKGFTNGYIQLAPGHTGYLRGDKRLSMSFGDGTLAKRSNANQTNPEAPQARFIQDPKRKRAKAAEQAAAAAAQRTSDDNDLDDDFEYHPSDFEDTVETPPARQAPVTRVKMTRAAVNQIENVTDPTQGCYEALIKLRDQQITAVYDPSEDFPDEIVQTVACLRPQSRNALMETEGINQNFVKAHGTQILKICLKFKNAADVNSTSESPAINMSKQLKRFAAPSTSTSITRSKPINRTTTSTSSGGPTRGGVSAMPIPR